MSQNAQEYGIGIMGNAKGIFGQALAHGAPHLHDAQRAHQHGEAVQVDPMRPKLIPRGTKRLKVK
jgi:hypothetical protein